MKIERNVLFVVLALAGVLGAALRDQYLLHIAVMVLFYAVLATSLNLLVGYVGEFSLGHTAFLGVGAYTAALCATHLGWPMWITIPAGGIVAGITGLLIGAITLRLQGPFFVIVTLAFAEVLRLTANNWIALTNGPMGLAGIPQPAWLAGGSPTERTLLNAETAMEIAARHGRADFVIAHGVLAAVSDLFGFAAGFAGVLRPNGIAALDFPHLLWLMDQTRFDCIDHAHQSYLSLLVVERILRSVGLVVFDLERLPPPGGDLRIFAGHARGPYLPRPSVKSMRMREVAAGLDRPPGYDLFTLKAAASVKALREFIDHRRRSGRRIAAHGVTAEANTLLNKCGLTHNDILCVADPDPARQDMLLPGSQIPIVSPRTLRAFRPDDVLVFPPDGPFNVAMDLAAQLPDRTCFWSLMPAPRTLSLRSEAA